MGEREAADEIRYPFAELEAGRADMGAMDLEEILRAVVAYRYCASGAESVRQLRVVCRLVAEQVRGAWGAEPQPGKAQEIFSYLTTGEAEHAQSGKGQGD